MDYTKLSIEEIERIIKIFRKSLESDHLNDQAKSYLLQELRDANLEVILSRD